MLEFSYEYLKIDFDFLDINIQKGYNMGEVILDKLIDFEIRPVIKSFNELYFIQTVACCSGWSDSRKTGTDNVSDGINRKWLGNPYVYLLSLDDKEMINFIKFIEEKIQSENNKDKNIGNGGYLINILVEYRNDKLLFILNIVCASRTYEQIQITWNMLNNLTKEYKKRLTI